MKIFNKCLTYLINSTKNDKNMKVKSTYNGKSKIHKSYASFYRWAMGLDLFVSSNGSKHLTPNTSSLSFLQKDGAKLEVTNRLF